MAGAKRTPKPKPPPDPNKLAREAAGSYRSGDGRFLVRQDRGGKWYVTDSEQTNELGLELVIGPFDTIAEAKTAVGTQREQPAGAAPGAKIRTLVQRDRKHPKSTSTPKRERSTKPISEPKPAPAPAREPEPEPEPQSPTTEYRPAHWRPTGDAHDTVAAAVRAINAAWTARSPEAMRDVLASDVVFVQPGFNARIEGREAAIESYRDFASTAVVHAYAESELTIDVSGHTATASYRWEIDYETGGTRFVDTGHDLFVFDRVGTRWLAVWRLLIPDPLRPGS